MTKLIRFVKQEAVLSVAAVLAVVSAFFVPPDEAYLGYIDYRTLAILFSLMTVMAGLRQQGVFDRMGRALLALTGGTLQLVLVLVGLCFFGSMFITNDVSLLTFVPFAFVVLDSLGPEARQKLILPVVCMQTIGANLGSMLTPIGNPQNLYLYGRSGMGMGAFVALMLPYTLLSLGMLAAWAVWLCRGGSPVRKGTGGPFLAPRPGLRADRRIVWMDAALFVVCLLAVMRAVPYGAAFAAVLAATLLADRATLARVDYSLLLTFVAFFLFIGNLGRVPAFSAWLGQVIAGREVLVSVLAQPAKRPMTRTQASSRATSFFMFVPPYLFFVVPQSRCVTTSYFFSLTIPTSFLRINLYILRFLIFCEFHIKILFTFYALFQQLRLQ